MTASPVKLVALLYDKAIVSLREAVQAIETGNVQDRWKANNRATEILTHLCTTLDHESGGDIAQNLHQLYQFMLGRLFEVDMKNDAEAAREVIGLLEPLRDSWRELAEQTPEQQQAGTEPAARPQASPAKAGAQGYERPTETFDLSA